MGLESLALRLGKVLFLLAFLTTATCAQQKTVVADTLVGPTGVAATGSLRITAAQTFTSADGFVVPLGQAVTVTLSSSGAFSVALIPTVGATPSGVWYRVSYKMASIEVNETWMVPSNVAPVSLIAVRVLSPPIPSANISVSQIVPAPNIGSVAMNLENPTLQDSGKFQWKARNGFTITRVSCSVYNQGSVDVNLDVRQEASPNTPGTPVLTTPLTCLPTTGATTSIANAVVAGRAPLALNISAVNGGASVVQVYVEYRLNP
jgi:hypothetical protein